MAANDVYLPSNASIVLPLFFPKKVSAPPEIAPDNPADLPDCNKTITIIDTENTICNIFTSTFKDKHLLKN